MTNGIPSSERPVSILQGQIPTVTGLDFSDTILSLQYFYFSGKTPEQFNTVTAFIDGSAVYGCHEVRYSW